MVFSITAGKNIVFKWINKVYGLAFYTDITQMSDIILHSVVIILVILNPKEN